MASKYKQVAKKVNIKDKLNTKTMCRLCLAQCDAKNLVDIFDASSEQSLTIRIMACAGLEVTQHDLLPKKICTECRLQLEKSFLFRNKSKNSDSKLRRHFRLVNAGKPSHVFDDSEDEFEDDYTESIQIIDEFESILGQKQDDIVNDRLQEAIAKETKRIYGNAKTMFDKQLQIGLKQNEKNRKTKKITGAPSSVKRKRSNSYEIKDENNDDDDDDDDEVHNTIEVLVDEHIDEEEFVTTVAVEKEELDLVPEYDALGSSDEQDMDSNEDAGVEEKFHKTVNQSRYTIQDSGEIEPLEEAQPDSFDDNDSQNPEEFLEDDFTEEKFDEYLETILPAIKKSIIEKSGIVLGEDTQYKITKKPDNELEVECLTADGRIYNIEMVMASLSATCERDEAGDLKIFVCKKCPKTFSRRGKLLNHERDHEVKTNGQECSICQKWFPSNSTLARHFRVHTGERPYKCEECGRKFIQKEILKRHLMTHSGERPYKCDHCEKSFILKETLKQHINRNHMENPTVEMHRCVFCPKAFCHSSGLSRHLLIHAGRVFNCDFCAKQFNDKSALKRHTATIHNVKITADSKPAVFNDGASKDTDDF